MATSASPSPIPFLLIRNFGNTGNGGRGESTGVSVFPHKCPLLVSEIPSTPYIKGGEFSPRRLKFGEFLRTLRAHLDLVMMIEMSMIIVAGKATEEMNMSSFSELYVSKLDALMEELNAIRQQPESLRQELLNRISQMQAHYAPQSPGEQLCVDEIIVSWLELHLTSLCTEYSKTLEHKKFFTRRKNSGQRRYNAAVKSLRQ